MSGRPPEAAPVSPGPLWDLSDTSLGPLWDLLNLSLRLSPAIVNLDPVPFLPAWPLS